MKNLNNSLKVNKVRKNKSKGTKKNRKGGQLALPGSGTLNFAGADVGSWVNGLGAPVVLVGLRELLKGSKKDKQKGGQLSLPGNSTFNFAGENIGNWVNGLGVPAVLVGVRELMKGSKKNKQKGGKRNKSLKNKNKRSSQKKGGRR